MPAIIPTPHPRWHKLSCEARPRNEHTTEQRPATAAPPPAGERGAAEPRTSRPGPSQQRYAIVPDWATQAQYIWDPDADAWYGPWATRWDAELTLLRWRAERLRAAPQNGARQ